MLHATADTASSIAKRNANIESAIDLIAAQDKFSIIDIKTADSDRLFQSAILAVDTHTRSILIEEPFPNDLGDIVGKQIEMKLRLTGNQSTHLHSVVIGREFTAQSIRYRVAMPANCTYRQRREAYRFKLATTSAYGCEFLLASTFFCKGILLDISLSGVRALLSNQSGVAVGEIIERFNFEFAGTRFYSEAIVHNITTTHEGNDIIGVALIDMARPQLRQLERILAGMHRQLAKQHSSGRMMKSEHAH